MKRMGPRLALAIALIALVVAGTAAAQAGGMNALSGIKLDRKTLTISPLDTAAKLSVLRPENGNLADEPVIWSIRPESVADIDPDTGVITPKVQSGRAVVTATGKLSGEKASCALIVRAVGVKSVKLNAKNLTIGPGKQFRLRAVVQPANATYSDVEWSVKSLTPPAQDRGSRLDTRTGILTAGNVEGETLIVTATAGGKTVSAVVKVQSAAVSAVKFKKSSYVIRVSGKYNLKKQLVISPSREANTAVTWTSDNEQVATVDEQGVVTLLDEGTAKITATSVDNPEKYARCTVKGKVVRVKTVSLSAKNAVGDPGDSLTVTAKVAPSNASFREIDWSSSDTSVATVDQEGNISIRGAGKAVVTASADKGRKSASLNVYGRGGSMRTVKISAVGDVVIGGDKTKVKKADGLIGDGMSSYQRFRSLFDKYGPGYFFAGVSDLFRGDDITIVNFEGTLTNAKTSRWKTFHFQGDPVYAQIPAMAGVEVANLANNHSADFGSRGYSDTVKHLKSVGINPVGPGSGKTAVIEVNGVRVGFAGFKAPVNRADLKKAIRKLKRNQGCQVVVVSLHWAASREWTSSVTGYERSTSRFAVNAGADLVLGHHKHVLSGIERYKGKVIAYDLGNFVAMIRNRMGSAYTDKDSMIYQQRFNIFEDGFVECAVPNIIPCMNSDTQEVLTGNPHLLTGEDAERALNKIRKRTPSKDKELVQTIPGY